VGLPALNSQSPSSAAAAIRPRANLYLGLLTIACACAVAAILYVFNPGQHGFYPSCLFHRMTSLQCPGCGSLRALHQLLHGNVLEALRLNALLVLALPIAGWLLTRAVAPLFGLHLKPLSVRSAWLWAGFALVVAFAILRNF
jgi:hypothetical protein